MDRAELCMVNTYKCEELRKKLNPITNCDEVKEGRLIFHNTDNNIYNINRFSEYNKEDNIVWYKNATGQLYYMSSTGWYYYDEFVADQVNEYFTPKLYVVNSVKYKEDYWFIVSFNDDFLKRDFLRSMRMSDVTDKEFCERYEYSILKEVDEFEIVLK